MKKRIEIHLDDIEVRVLDEMAHNDIRSRKNFCETEIKKLIAKYQEEKAKQLIQLS